MLGTRKMCIVSLYVMANVLLGLEHSNTGCEVFKGGGTKLERFLHKNQYTQRKLLNFKLWIYRELSKIGHHFW